MTDTDNNSTITAWSADRFTTRGEPLWWEDAIKALWSGPEGQASCQAVQEFTEGLNEVMVYPLGQGQGWVAYLYATDTPSVVWMEDEAEYLNFVTIGAPRWVGLRDLDFRAVGQTLNDIRNTLIGFARFGQGQHVSKEGDQNAIDTQRDREERKRQRSPENPG